MLHITVHFGNYEEEAPIYNVCTGAQVRHIGRKWDVSVYGRLVQILEPGPRNLGLYACGATHMVGLCIYIQGRCYYDIGRTLQVHNIVHPIVKIQIRNRKGPSLRPFVRS
jgi:hypothetical protein